MKLSRQLYPLVCKTHQVTERCRAFSERLSVFLSSSEEWEKRPFSSQDVKPQRKFCHIPPWTHCLGPRVGRRGWGPTLPPWNLQPLAPTLVQRQRNLLRFNFLKASVFKAQTQVFKYTKRVCILDFKNLFQNSKKKKKKQWKWNSLLNLESRVGERGKPRHMNLVNVRGKKSVNISNYYPAMAIFHD